MAAKYCAAHIGKHSSSPPGSQRATGFHHQRTANIYTAKAGLSLVSSGWSGAEILFELVTLTNALSFMNKGG